MRTPLPGPQWRKSSHSNGTGGECVEVAWPNDTEVTAVRDSKQRGEGPILEFPTQAWLAFTTHLTHP